VTLGIFGQFLESRFDEQTVSRPRGQAELTLAPTENVLKVSACAP
jgi:hypothetical protein